MKELLAIIRALRGRISETMRSSVAHAMADMVAEQVEGETANWWAAGGRTQFLRDCGIMQEPWTTPDELTATPTALAEFINRWRATTKYKDGDEWKDFTQEMAGLVTTMTEQLEDVALEVPE